MDPAVQSEVRLEVQPAVRPEVRPQVRPQDRPPPEHTPNPIANVPPSSASPSSPQLGNAGNVMADATTVEQYRLVLVFAVRQHASQAAHAPQPSQASRANAGDERRTRVRIEIGADGQISDIHLRESSGNDAADQHALAMVARAIAQAPVPATLLGRAFKFDLTLLTQSE